MSEPYSAEKDAGHYFAFSRNWLDGKRLCGECSRTYDGGDHIEVTVLKPYTSYVCPTGGGLGHSGRWTGAYRPELRSLRDKFCMCGAELVEEDAEKWLLSWEMQTPFHDEWRPVTKVDSKHATHSQRDGLLDLIDQGEPIRNVSLTRVPSPAETTRGER